MDFTQVSYILEQSGKSKHCGFVIESGSSITQEELQKTLINACDPLKDKGIQLKIEKMVTTQTLPSEKDIPIVRNIGSEELSKLSIAIQNQAKTLL